MDRTLENRKVLLDNKLCESRVLRDLWNWEAELSLKAQESQLILVSASRRAAVWTEAERISQLPQAGTNIVTLLDTNPLNKKAFLV